jgi:hypothetical protein
MEEDYGNFIKFIRLYWIYARLDISCSVQQLVGSEFLDVWRIDIEGELSCKINLLRYLSLGN